VRLRAADAKLGRAWCNPTQLQQVLDEPGHTNAWHALGDGAGQSRSGSRACDFSEGQAPPQSCSYYPRWPARAYARLWVRDDAAAMSDEHASALRAFFTTKSLSGGALAPCLGWPWCHGIVKRRWPGAIEVTSALRPAAPRGCTCRPRSTRAARNALDARSCTVPAMRTMRPMRTMRTERASMCCTSTRRGDGGDVQGPLASAWSTAPRTCLKPTAAHLIDRTAEPANFDLGDRLQRPNVSGLYLFGALASVRPDLPVGESLRLRPRRTAGECPVLRRVCRDAEGANLSSTRRRSCTLPRGDLGWSVARPLGVRAVARRTHSRR